MCAVLAAALAVSSGCAARRFDALMQSWQGHSIEELFRTWGPPNYLYSDGKGGRVAVYVPPPEAGVTRSRDAGDRLRSAASTQIYDRAMTGSWPIYRIFFFDVSGRIVTTEWRGRWECCSG
jgi:hypothetical protein